MNTALDAKDIGASIRAARRSRGLTQAALADRAGVGRQWLIAVERGHDRAEIGKVAAVLGTLGRTLAVRPSCDQPADARTWLTAGDTAKIIRNCIELGDTGLALRSLARAISDFRDLNHSDDVRMFLAEPPSTGDHRWDTLIAAGIGRECRRAGIDSPAWTRVPSLTSWWFPIFDPILTARTMQRTPIDFSARGIWLDRRALEIV